MKLFQSSFLNYKNIPSIEIEKGDGCAIINDDEKGASFFALIPEMEGSRDMEKTKPAIMFEFSEIKELRSVIEGLQQMEQILINREAEKSQNCTDCKNEGVANFEQHLKCKECFFIGNQQSNFEPKDGK